jgi:hypothetical protein
MTLSPNQKEAKDLLKPGKVETYRCIKCGELLLRVFPWALNVKIQNDGKTMVCKRCVASNLKVI